jgi:hypothetical protein
LEYVRFFTSAACYRFFDLGGVVEILPGDVNEKSPFNVIDTKVFKKHFQEAKVQEISNRSSEGKEFSITRTVVALDQKIYQITEFVREDGFYDVSSQKVISNDALKLGIVHLGDI